MSCGKIILDAGKSAISEKSGKGTKSIGVNRGPSVANRFLSVFLALLMLGSVFAAVPTAMAGDEACESKFSPQLNKELERVGPAEIIETFIGFGRLDDNGLELLEDMELPVLREYKEIDYVFTLATKAQILELARSPLVNYLDYNYELEYYLDTATEATLAKEVWDESFSHFDFIDPALPTLVDAEGNVIDGSGIGVAVIDSGVDATHPDLEWHGKVVMNLKGVSSKVLVNTQTGHTMTQWVDVPDSDTSSGHGTHCAGIVAGDGTSSNGQYRGAAPGASIYGLGCGEAILVLNGLEGLQWVIENHDTVNPPIKVVSCSWGSTGAYSPSSAISMAVNEIVRNGITVCFAAGNDGGTGTTDATGSESKNPNALSVANYDDGDSGSRDRSLASSSSRGQISKPETWPDISAPGSNIMSTAGTATPLAAAGMGGVPVLLPYALMSGTSMACPHVAGIVALMYQANPDLTPAEVEDIIESTAYKFTALGEYDETTGSHYAKGHGLIDAYKCVLAAGGTGSGAGLKISSPEDGGAITTDTCTIEGVISSGETTPVEPKYYTGDPHIYTGGLIDPTGIAMIAGINVYTVAVGEPVGLSSRNTKPVSDKTIDAATLAKFLIANSNGAIVYTIQSDGSNSAESSGGYSVDASWTVPTDAPSGDYVMHVMINYDTDKWSEACNLAFTIVGTPATPESTSTSGGLPAGTNSGLETTFSTLEGGEGDVPYVTIDSPLDNAMVSGNIEISGTAGVGIPPQSDFNGDGIVVIAIVDTGINFFHKDFRATTYGNQAVYDLTEGFTKHPSTYLGDEFPSNAQPINIEWDEEKIYSTYASEYNTNYPTISKSSLYWIPGTKIIGAKVGGGSIASNNRILDGDGHGTGSASVAAGNIYGYCPDALLVIVEGTDSLAWVYNQPWIDFVSNSWGTIANVGAPFFMESSTESTRTAVERGQTVLFAGGNGAANTFTVPHTTYSSEYTGPDWIVTVGAVTTGSDQSIIGSGKPVDISSYGSGTIPAAHSTSVDATGSHSGTSAATPYTAGVFATALLAARNQLEDNNVGQYGGAGQIIAKGTTTSSGPLSDGILTRSELQEVVFKTAQPCDMGWITVPATYPLSGFVPDYPLVGYGIANPASRAEAVSVMLGNKDMPDRSDVDAWMEYDEDARDWLWGDYDSNGDGADGPTGWPESSSSNTGLPESLEGLSRDFLMDNPDYVFNAYLSSDGFVAPYLQTTMGSETSPEIGSDPQGDATIGVITGVGVPASGLDIDKVWFHSETETTLKITMKLYGNAGEGATLAAPYSYYVHFVPTDASGTKLSQTGIASYVNRYVKAQYDGSAWTYKHGYLGGAAGNTLTDSGDVACSVDGIYITWTFSKSVFSIPDGAAGKDYKFTSTNAITRALVGIVLFTVDRAPDSGNGADYIFTGGVASTVPGKVPTPTALSGNRYVNLSWNAPASDGGSAITQYKIYRNGTIGAYATVPATQRWYNNTGLVNGITYTYNVSATNLAGEGAKSDNVQGTPTAGGTPSGKRVEVSIDGGAWLLASGTLSWTYPWDSTAVSNDPHTIKAKYFDGTAWSAIDEVTVNVQNGGQANQPPACMLSASPTSGNAPLAVTFTMSGSDTDGNIASWKLDINNDGSAEYQGTDDLETTSKTQAHTYTTPGSYTANLTVTDDGGKSAFNTVDISVSVYVPPVHDEGVFLVINDGAEVNATNTSSDGKTWSSWDYNWQLGELADGEVTIEAFYYDGLEAEPLYTDSVTVTVDRIVDADAGGHYEGITGEPLQFAGVANGGDGEYSYGWDFGDGMSSVEQNPVHIYEATGWYTATFTVQKGGDVVASDTADVIIKNPSVLYFHSTVLADGVSAGSPDVGGELPSEQWMDFDKPENAIPATFTGLWDVTPFEASMALDGGVVIGKTGDDVMVDLHFNQHGNAGLVPYMSLNLYDGETLIARLVDSGENVDAIIGGTLAYGSYRMVLGHERHVENNDYEETMNAPLEGFVDGEPFIAMDELRIEVLNEFDLPAEAAWTILYDSPDYASCVELPIWSPLTPPKADFTWMPAVPNPGDEVRFSDVSTDADEGDEIVSWAWDFESDGIVDSTSSAPVRVFDEPGEYVVSLTVTDSYGYSDTAVKTIRVNDPPAAYAEAGPVGGPYGKAVRAPAGGDVEFTGDGSTDSDGEIISYVWDFGDGSPIAKGESVTHAYEAGQGLVTYVATLTVTDNDGASSSDTVNVLVRPGSGGPVKVVS